MLRLPTFQLTRSLRAPRNLHSHHYVRCLSISGAPKKSDQVEHFVKTGEKGPSDPTQINVRKTEYSQSGGDDIVADNAIAAFEGASTDPGVEKELAGRGNTVNPLEASPATPELSSAVEEPSVQQGAAKAKRENSAK
ncbi:hypothetical protein BS50DRAFT_583999 [Corynespora cassiicola Philippines]|uniref:Uncharacterized protein n=1 Tax=Corynespora cassiicola Philippines TaxID=1448308 RepID=A0A2T2P454_CORCC|nr:hypothetical protein BS50DRAFT_583999 [Corynespora cassiicola Philippines]